MLSFLSALSWIITFLVGLITLLLVGHYMRVRSLPPGPFPLPILGNVLEFRGEGNDFKTAMRRWGRKYKTMYTLWLGPNPSIVVCSWELCKEALVNKKHDFSGRVKRRSTNLFLNGHEDVTFSDYGPQWETLRKVLHSAVRKYAVSDKLAVLATDVVDATVEQICEIKGSVEITKYIYLIIYNVMASSAFGKRFEMDDPEFLRLKNSNEKSNEKFGSQLPSDSLPFLSWFYQDEENAISYLASVFQGFIRETFKEHKTSYQKGVVRDFTDAVLASREEALEDGKQTSKYMTDDNLVMLLVDLFFAGTDSTRVTLLWILLLMCDEPEIQQLMYNEIKENIGSKAPVQSDRHKCPYTYSVIAEVLRMRPPVEITLEHKTICDTELGGFKIPKNTGCIFLITNSHYNASLWEGPKDFNPERFRDTEGLFINSRHPGYMPFGLGPRACPGEKLALADIFLITTRLIQKCSFELKGGPGSANMVPDTESFFNFPMKYKLLVKKREDF